MNRRILYVDDDHDDFQLLQKAFHDIDADVELINVSNGYDTIKFLQESDEENFPSLILMDINMPLIDGKETARLLQVDDKFKKIPVVFFSTSASPFDKKIIEKSGAELITKPSLYEEWLAIARKLAQLYCFIFLYSAICCR
jgi:CheY-like chemotaxis protein